MNPQDTFAEGLSLYQEGRKAEIVPATYRMMERVASAIEAEMTTKEIQSNCIANFGWTPSKKQIAAIRGIISDTTPAEQIP